MSDDGRTHHADCYLAHHDCARAEVETLREIGDRLRKKHILELGCEVKWRMEAEEKERALRAEVERLRAAVRALAEALEWCGGSGDFSDTNLAGEGWHRVVIPALALPVVREVMGGE